MAQSIEEDTSLAIDLAAGGNDPEGDDVTFAVSGLPSGMTWSGSQISGSPTTAGTYAVTVDAIDIEFTDQFGG